MANRTGTQLKSDMTSVDTALSTAIGSPTDANIQAVIAALATVEQNGLDSRYQIQTPGGPQVAQFPALDTAMVAREAKRELEYVMGTQHNVAGASGGNAERIQALRLLKARMDGPGGGWDHYRAKPTTT